MKDATQTTELDGWNYRTKPDGYGDSRKLVTLEDGGMIWIGIRAWHHINKCWYNNGEPERVKVKAWREMPPIANGWWDRGILHFPMTEQEANDFTQQKLDIANEFMKELADE